MNIFYQPELPNITYLDHEESKHCVKVLRKVTGDIIQVIDGKGNLYEASITDPSHKKCSFSIIEVMHTPPSPIYRHIAIAPTKNIDRIEWFIEKAVEIGIDEISFILCEHSERNVLKLDRIQKKAISAIKQSYKFYMPKINELISYNDFIQQTFEDTHKFIAFVDFENPVQLQNSLVTQGNRLTVIGPEGDFSLKEIEKAESLGFTKVGLGHSRLRTETAGIVACHLMTIINNNFKIG